MSFEKREIEALITKAKSLDLSYLRVADDDDEITIELSRSVAPPILQSVEKPVPLANDVTSQFVGYFRPTLEVGAKVDKGVVVGVVESLGLPNDVVASGAGTLVEIKVQEGDAVQYGTVVARIES